MHSTGGVDVAPETPKVQATGAGTLHFAGVLSEHVCLIHGDVGYSTYQGDGDSIPGTSTAQQPGGYSGPRGPRGPKEHGLGNKNAKCRVAVRRSRGCTRNAKSPNSGRSRGRTRNAKSPNSGRSRGCTRNAKSPNSRLVLLMVSALL